MSIEKHIAEGIKKYVDKIIQEEIENAKLSIVNRLNKFADGLALDLLKEYDIERNGNIITIRVIKAGE